MHILYDDIVEDWEKRFSHVCYHSKKLSIAIWASSSTIKSPATLHFSIISWACGGDFYTSHQNSFAKDCSKSNKLQETHCKRFLSLCIRIARSYVIIQLGPSTTHFLVLLHSLLQFSRMPEFAVVSSAPQRIAKDLREEQAIIAIMWIGTLSCFNSVQIVLNVCILH